MCNFNAIRNKQGMSLVEVMIIITVMSIMTLGMASMFKNITSIQSQTVTRTALYEVQKNIEEAIRSDTGWALSVNDPPNVAVLGCLRDGAQCAANTFNNANLNIFDTAGNRIFQGAAANRGFTFNGQECSGYAAAGSATCPFRYTFRVELRCRLASPCDQPEVQVIGNLVFSPLDPTDVKNRMNLSDYRIRVNRGSRARYEPFELRFRDTGAGNNVGGGQCRRNQWIPRPLNQLIDHGGGANVVGFDPANARQIPPAPPAAFGPADITTGLFSLRPGTYECTIIAQAFEPRDGFQIRLRDTETVAANRAGPFAAGGGFASESYTVYSNATITFTITDETQFRLEHRCNGWSDLTHPDGNSSSYHMGIPLPTYGGGEDATTYTSISCVRSS